ncbi:MAG: DUF1353 domain-containing protein [Cycloclasticus sp.]|jgi:hypothetical protein|nr:DUF1353 domain-containing protein [Cycloclasticus sp.]
MAFLTTLQTEHVKDKDWRVISALAYMTSNDELIVVKKGFITDYASIPKLLLSIFGRPSGKMVEPSVLHDFLYQAKTKYTRKESDLIFLEALKGKGINWFKRRAMYYGVRIGGGSSWKGK